MEKIKDTDAIKIVEKIAKDIAKNPQNLDKYNKVELENILKALKTKQQKQVKNKDFAGNVVKDANLLGIVGISSIWAGLGTIMTLYNYPESTKNPNLATITSIFLLALGTEIEGKFIPAPILKAKIEQAQSVLEKYTNNEPNNNLYSQKKVIKIKNDRQEKIA